MLTRLRNLTEVSWVVGRGGQIREGLAVFFFRAGLAVFFGGGGVNGIGGVLSHPSQGLFLAPSFPQP